MIYARMLHLYAFVTKYDIGPSSRRYTSIQIPVILLPHVGTKDSVDAITMKTQS